MRCWGLVYSVLTPRAANEETERGGIPPGTGHRLRYLTRGWKPRAQDAERSAMRMEGEPCGAGAWFTRY